jgi:hypothetical protein
MKKVSVVLLTLVSLMLFNRCSNDVDINASYQQITVVYGLLDTNEDTTYLKINKAFLGEDNALIMAQIPDSSEFIQKLDVKIWAEDDPQTIYTFDTTTLNNKEEGIFYNPNQQVYYSAFQPLVDKNYKLEINLKDQQLTSETRTFEFSGFDISSPGFAKKIRIDDNTEPRQIEWFRKDEAPRYDVLVRFHFKEMWEGSADTVYRHIDWYRNTVKSTSGEYVESYYTGNTFYVALDTYVPYADADTEAKVLDRFTGKIDFIIYAGGIDLATYMEVNEPSSSIIQDRPDYSNIENGIGIFSSRGWGLKSKLLQDESVFYLKENFYYLKFRY